MFSGNVAYERTFSFELFWGTLDEMNSFRKRWLLTTATLHPPHQSYKVWPYLRDCLHEFPGNATTLRAEIASHLKGVGFMPTKKSSGRKYRKGAGKAVKSAIHRKKKGTLKSGKGRKGRTVKSRKQAIAIGLSEARKKGAKVPKKK
jgi:hypothetical protein